MNLNYHRPTMVNNIIDTVSTSLNSLYKSIHGALSTKPKRIDLRSGKVVKKTRAVEDQQKKIQELERKLDWLMQQQENKQRYESPVLGTPKRTRDVLWTSPGEPMILCHKEEPIPTRIPQPPTPPPVLIQTQPPILFQVVKRKWNPKTLLDEIKNVKLKPVTKPQKNISIDPFTAELNRKFKFLKDIDDETELRDWEEYNEPLL